MFSSTKAVFSRCPPTLPCFPAHEKVGLDPHAQPRSRQASLPHPPSHFQRLRNVKLLVSHITFVLVTVVGIIIESNQEILQACRENRSGCLPLWLSSFSGGHMRYLEEMQGLNEEEEPAESRGLASTPRFSPPARWVPDLHRQPLNTSSLGCAQVMSQGQVVGLPCPCNNVFLNLLCLADISSDNTLFRVPFVGNNPFCVV